MIASSTYLQRIGSRVRVTNLKDLALKMPKDHPLRAVMLVENDEMSAEEYCSKIGMWLRLLNGV